MEAAFMADLAERLFLTPNEAAAVLNRNPKPSGS
jgi:hypothetical protein